ncbi:MAG: hypothetical protein U9O18_05665, partial [Chloroflexota bacterium]|nr:hypothetical protein [Chloroflexota bacterium]
MPAIEIPTWPTGERRLRLVVGVLAVVFLCSIGTVASTPAEARNWTPQIAATRSSQLYYESAMRAADREIQVLKRAKKQTKTKLKRAQRSLRRAVRRRNTVKRNVRQTHSHLHAARAALAATVADPPPPPDTATAILVLQEPAPIEPSTEDADM